MNLTMSEESAAAMTDLRGTLRFWERGRWLYNALLFILGLMWSWDLRTTMAEQALLGYWGSVAAFGLTANVFYTLGPAAEVYTRVWAGKAWGRPGRLLLWLAGTLMATSLTWTFVWSMEILYLVLYPHAR